MFEGYIENGAFNLEALEEDMFFHCYEEQLFDYDKSKCPEHDYVNARWAWQCKGLFEQYLREQLEDGGYKEYGSDRLYGRFVWIRELDLLVVQDNDSARLQPVVAKCNKGGLDDLEYALGFMIAGLFLVRAMAEKVIV